MKHDDRQGIPHVVIVGGGFGGLRAARSLAKAPVRVTLVDKSNHHLFQPLLYQVATAGLSPAEIATPIRSILGGQANAEVLMAEVTGIDRAARRVWMGPDCLDYDYLILATGARDSYFGHDEWAKHAPGLKSIPQATQIRRDILLAFEAAEMEMEMLHASSVHDLEASMARRAALLTFVLVGAGPTGVEMSGAIAELAHTALAKDFHYIDPTATRVLLVEAGPRILSSFPEELSEQAAGELRRLGVEIRTGTAVESIDAEGVIVAGERIACKNVIWAAGVRASAAAQWLGAEADRAGRVLVGTDLSVPGSPEIFVIGDTMRYEQGGKPLPGVAQVAIQQGSYVARLIRNRILGRRAPQPFAYTDKGNLATVGRAFAVLDANGIHLAGFVAWVLWLGIHIFYLIGFRNRLLVIMQWAWAYITFGRGARLITGEKPIDPLSVATQFTETPFESREAAPRP